MKQIDEGAFAEAWADEDNTRMMRHAARPYRDLMTHDEWIQLQRIALLNTLESHDPSRRKFISSLRLRTLWVFKTHARGFFRAKRRLERYANEGRGPAFTEPSEGVSADREWVDAMLGRLDEDERLVVAHRYMDDLSLSEISRRTGMPRSRVGRLHRTGMVKLKKFVSESEI